jgi:hypothetical protein
MTTCKFIGSVFAVISLFTMQHVLAQALATQPAIFGPLNHTYNLKIGDQSYPIRYGIPKGNGIVQSITANYTSKSIVVIIDDENDSSSIKLFSIQLPRNIIDSNTTQPGSGCTGTFSYQNTTPSWSRLHDLPYKITITMLPSNKPATFPNGYYGGELCAYNTRTLTIDYPSGKSMIVIQGTVMVPEFGSSISALVMTLGIVGTLGAGILVRRRKTL